MKFFAAFLVLCACSMHVAVADKNETEPVEVEIYYESKCPFCREFIIHSFKKAWENKAIRDIMEVSLIPYGNAKETVQGDHYTFKCQHGPEECLGNLIEACALNVFLLQGASIPYIICLEQDHRPFRLKGPFCAKKIGMPYNPVEKCVKAKIGNTIQHTLANITGELDPPHTYVPWVVINGKHSDKLNDQATENLTKVVCEFYKGPKPAACDEIEKDEDDNSMSVPLLAGPGPAQGFLGRKVCPRA